MGHYPCVLWSLLHIYLCRVGWGGTLSLSSFKFLWSGIVSLCSLKSAAILLVPYWVRWDIIPVFFQVCCNSACAVLGEVGHYPCSLKFAATLSVLYWVGWDIIPVFFEVCCHSTCAILGGVGHYPCVLWSLLPLFLCCIYVGWDISPMFFEVGYHPCVLWSLLQLFLCLIFLGWDITSVFLKIAATLPPVLAIAIMMSATFASETSWIFLIKKDWHLILRSQTQE